jgi:drug/metabolite transporter (DMT)-like permease
MLKTFRTKWFLYSMCAVLSWSCWAFTAKFGSEQLPPDTEQFMAAFGFLLVGFVLLIAMRFRLQLNPKGAGYGVAAGVLLAAGSIALFAAYHTGANTAVVTTATGLYPMVTVLLAIIFLKERLTRLQLLGVLFAVAAMVIFSL